MSEDLILWSSEFTLKVFKILVHPSKCKGVTTKKQLTENIFVISTLLHDLSKFLRELRCECSLHNLSKKIAAIFIWYDFIAFFPNSVILKNNEPSLTSLLSTWNCFLLLNLSIIFSPDAGLWLQVLKVLF